MNEDIMEFVEQSANEDAEAAILHFEDATGIEHNQVYLDDITYQDGEDGVRAIMTFILDNPKGSMPEDNYGVEIEVAYWVEGDELEGSDSPEDISNQMIETFKDDGAIEASTTITDSTPIMAAGEDDDLGGRSGGFMNDDMFAEDIEDDDIDEQLDDISDTVEDLQDSVDEVEEDDVQIEVNNNIENHYIAECESCQGIFISSVVKSDQYLDKISGVCPLCNKETDQYLKWVVSPLE